jgi:hypothetical protein
LDLFEFEINYNYNYNYRAKSARLVEEKEVGEGGVKEWKEKSVVMKE